MFISRGLHVFAFLAAALTAAGAGLDEWESLMQAERPYLPQKESLTLRTLEALSAVSNADADGEFRAVAVDVLGSALPAGATWQTAFDSPDERIDIADYAAPSGGHGRFAVYGQYGNCTPYYWIVDGLAPGRGVVEFLRENALVGGSSRILEADGVFDAGEVVIAGRGEEIAPPFERFHFALVDDRPGANWAHPCRYVFMSEDLTSFAVLYKRWMPRVFVRASGESVALKAEYSGASSGVKTLEEVKNSVYGYAKSLVSNGLAYRSGDRSKSYFVLISGGEDPNMNGIRFWSDTAMMYSTITLKYGVPKGNIRVYMSDGQSTGEDANLGSDWPTLVDSPWDLDGDKVSDVTGAATKANVRSCFSSLRSRLKATDQLFVFVTSHGDTIGTSGRNNYNCNMSLFTMEMDGYNYKDAETVTDKELASWTKGFACPVAFAIETCYSGGFIDDLVATPNRVVATACNHYEESWGTSGGGRWHSKYGQTGAFNYWAAPFISAFRGYKPYSYASYGYPWNDYSSANADSNGDGKVSFNEARTYATNHDGEEHPQYGENPRGLGSSFFLLKPSSLPTLFTGGKADTPFAGDATYIGWVRNADGTIAGQLSVKAGKAAKPEKGGYSKLTVSYTPVGGRKQALKLDEMPVAGRVATLRLPGLGTVKLTGDAIVGVNVDVQAGKDLLKSKDTGEKAAATAFAAGKSGAWTFALGTGAGYAAFSVTVDKKGKGKLAGTLPDGTKVSLSEQGVIGDNVLAIPFVFAKKGLLGFVFWVKANGTAAISDLTKVRLSDGSAYSASVVSPSAAHALSDGSHVFSAAGVSQGFTVAGKKWTVPKQSKKANPDPNPSGLKLSYKEKDGTVKGSFTAVGTKTKYTVVGVVVGGRFYGSAYSKGAGSVQATAR